MVLGAVVQREWMAGRKRRAITLESPYIPSYLITHCATLCNLYEPQFPICKMGMYVCLLYKVVVRIKILQVNLPARSRGPLSSPSLSPSIE